MPFYPGSGTKDAMNKKKPIAATPRRRTQPVMARTPRIPHASVSAAPAAATAGKDSTLVAATPRRQSSSEPKKRTPPVPKVGASAFASTNVAASAATLQKPLAATNVAASAAKKPEVGSLATKIETSARPVSDSSVSPVAPKRPEVTVESFRGSTKVMLSLGTIETTRIVLAHLDMTRCVDRDMYKVYISLEETINPNGVEINNATFNLEFQESISDILAGLGLPPANTTEFNSIGHVSIYTKDSSDLALKKLAMTSLTGSGPVPGGNISIPSINISSGVDTIVKLYLQIYFRRDPHILKITNAVNFNGTLVVSTNMGTFVPPVEEKEISFYVDGNKIPDFYYEKGGVITSEIPGKTTNVSIFTRGQCANSVTNILGSEGNALFDVI